MKIKVYVIDLELSARTRRILMVASVVVPLCALAFGIAGAVHAGPNPPRPQIVTFNPNTVLHASDLNTAFQSTVQSSGSNQRVESVLFGTPGGGGGCTSTPCTIDRQSGPWLSNVARMSTGNYVINIAPNIFSAPPTCVCSKGTGNGGETVCYPADDEATTTSVAITTVNPTTGVQDDVVSVICMGPQ